MGVGKGGQKAPRLPSWIFTDSSLKTYRISNFLSFLVVNTGSIRIAPPPWKFFSRRPYKQIAETCLFFNQ